MNTADVKLRSLSPVAFSRNHHIQKPRNEDWDVFEKRIFTEKAHYDDAGHVILPQMFFKNCIKEAAWKYPIKKIRTTTYKNNFQAGQFVLEPLVLPITKEGLQEFWLDVPADGKTGGGVRVPKCFPLIKGWEGTVQWTILDPEIPESVFRETLKTAGSLVGLGSLRIGRGGLFGRFEVVEMKWR